MAKDHGPSVKDDKLYQELREDGESKEKAARIANAKAAGSDVSSKGGSGEQLRGPHQGGARGASGRDRDRGPL